MHQTIDNNNNNNIETQQSLPSSLLFYRSILCKWPNTIYIHWCSMWFFFIIIIIIIIDIIFKYIHLIPVIITKRKLPSPSPSFRKELNLHCWAMYHFLSFFFYCVWWYWKLNCFYHHPTSKRARERLISFFSIKWWYTPYI